MEVEWSWFYYLDNLGTGPFDVILEMFPNDTAEDLVQFLRLVWHLIKDTIGWTTVAVEGKEVNAFDYLVRYSNCSLMDLEPIALLLWYSLSEEEDSHFLSNSYRLLLMRRPMENSMSTLLWMVDRHFSISWIHWKEVMWKRFIIFGRSLILTINLTST